MYQIKKLDKDGTFKHVIALLTCIGECCLDWYGQVLSVMHSQGTRPRGLQPSIVTFDRTLQLGALFKLYQQERLHPDCHRRQLILQGRRRCLPPSYPQLPQGRNAADRLDRLHFPGQIFHRASCR